MDDDTELVLDDIMDVLGALKIQGAEFRDRMKLDADHPLVVDIPHWKAEELVKKYGSLQEAADSVWRRGTVQLVDVYWRDWAVNALEIANRQMAVMFPPYRVGNRDEWTRIALAPYLR